MFWKIGILRHFAKFTRKHQCWSLLFNKLTGLHPAILSKRRLQHRCFPLILANLTTVAEQLFFLTLIYVFIKALLVLNVWEYMHKRTSCFIALFEWFFYIINTFKKELLEPLTVLLLLMLPFWRTKNPSGVTESKRADALSRFLGTCIGVDRDSSAISPRHEEISSFWLISPRSLIRVYNLPIFNKFSDALLQNFSLETFCNIPDRSSHRQCSLKTFFFLISQTHRKTVLESLFLIKLQVSSWHRGFLVNFATILRTPFLQNTSRRLFLSYLLRVLQLVKRCLFIWYLTQKSI